MFRVTGAFNWKAGRGICEVISFTEFSQLSGLPLSEAPEKPITNEVLKHFSTLLEHEVSKCLCLVRVLCSLKFGVRSCRIDRRSARSGHCRWQHRIFDHAAQSNRRHPSFAAQKRGANSNGDGLFALCRDCDVVNRSSSCPSSCLLVCAMLWLRFARK